MRFYILILIFGISFLVTYLSGEKFIRKLIKSGFVVPDVYKKETLVPTLGGLAIIAGVLVSLIVSIFLVPSIEHLLIFYFVIFTFAIFGLLDDLINVGRPLKIVAPFLMAFPIALLNTDTSLWVVITQIELGPFYSYIIAPLYLMVVVNLVNMHSGYNGLQSGLSTIILFFLTVKALMTHSYDEVVYIAPIFGALVAFLWYNKYPSRLFEGNIGSLAVGAAIGGYIIMLNDMEVYGVIILIPHIANFLMYVYWRVKKVPDSKFGRIREDGTLDVPNPLTLKWVLPYYRRMTEQQATYIMYGLTTVFGVIGLVVV